MNDTHQDACTTASGALLPFGRTNLVTGTLRRHPRSLDPSHSPAELLQENEAQIAALK